MARFEEMLGAFLAAGGATIAAAAWWATLTHAF